MAAVSVVGLFILLVVSSHGGSRSRVYQTVDLENHGRILKAVSSYAADNTDFLPGVGWGTASACWAHGTNLPSGFAGSLPQFEAIREQQLRSVTNGQLFPYLNDSRVFLCPGDEPNGQFFWQRTVFITSYVWNGAGNGYGYLTNSYKLSQFRPDLILEWEADGQVPFFFNDCSYFPDEGISSRHMTETLVGQFGGSVGTILITNWFKNDLAGAAGQHGTSIPLSLLPNRVWCSPRTPNGRQ